MKEKSVHFDCIRHLQSECVSFKRCKSNDDLCFVCCGIARENKQQNPVGHVYRLCVKHPGVDKIISIPSRHSDDILDVLETLDRIKRGVSKPLMHLTDSISVPFASRSVIAMFQSASQDPWMGFDILHD